MKHLILVVLATVTYSAYGQIHVKFANSTDKPIQVKIAFGDPTSPIESFREVYTQTIAPNSTSPAYIKIKDVKKKKKIYVSGTVSGLGNFKFDERIISARNQKIDLQLSLNVSSVPRLRGQ